VAATDDFRKHTPVDTIVSSITGNKVPLHQIPTLLTRITVDSVEHNNSFIQYHLNNISGFRIDFDEICALLGYYAMSIGNPIGCPETSVNDYHSTLRNISEERRSPQHRDGSLK
jgi:hypothetical protein